MTKFLVSPFGSVSAGSRTRVVLMPGTPVPDGLLDDTQISRLIASGAIHAVGTPAPKAIRENMPPVGVSDNAFFKQGKSADVEQTGGSKAEQTRAKLAAIEQARAAELAAKTTPPTTAPAEVSPWTFDPDGLVGTPIEELRQMVRKLDPDTEVDHLDEVELIALLSTDYVPVESTQG